MGQQTFGSRRQGRVDGIRWDDHNILDLTNQDVAKHPYGKQSDQGSDRTRRYEVSRMGADKIDGFDAGSHRNIMRIQISIMYIYIYI